METVYTLEPIHNLCGPDFCILALIHISYPRVIKSTDCDTILSHPSTRAWPPRQGSYIAVRFEVLPRSSAAATLKARSGEFITPRKSS